MKKQPNKWKKIFTNGTIDKGLISKVYKDLRQKKKKKRKEKRKKENHLKWAEDLDRKYTDGQ